MNHTTSVDKEHLPRNKLKITFVLPFASLTGGVRVIAIYAARLRQRGHQVCLVSLPAEKPTLRRTVRSLLRDRSWPSAPKDASALFTGLDVDHRVLESTRGVIDGDLPDADIVVATWWRTAAPVAELSRSKGVKVYFVQDYGANPGQPLESVVETWRYGLYKITMSQWMLNLVRKHVGDVPLSYVPNSVDHQQFNVPPRGMQACPTVGLMYANRPQKGLDVMLESIRLARTSLPDLHTVAYGPNDPVAELPLPVGSEYSKRAADEMLKEIYGKCDAWLFGSRLEGFGLPILEAMACRTPVIATPAGAAPELVNEGGGVLVGMDDPADMADAITRVCTLAEDKWRTMSDAAYATATGYSWDEATKLFEDALMVAVEADESSAAMKDRCADSG